MSTTSETSSSVPAYLSRKSNTSDVSATHVFPLTKPKMTLGRSPDSDINITAGFVSRLHAIINVNEDDVWSIVDKSCNGLYLNGLKLTKDLAKTLQHNDVISFGANPNQDLAYYFKKQSTMSRGSVIKAKKPRLEESAQTPLDVIVISDDEADEGPSVSTRKHKQRETSSPDKLALITKNKILEKKINEMMSEIEKINEETRREIETKQMELAMKEQEYELKLKMNTINVQQDLDVKLQTLTVELKAAKDEKEMLQSGLKQLEVNKTKELAMELERAGLEWTLSERERHCEELKMKLNEVEQKLKSREALSKDSGVDDELTKKVSNTVENELQCSICSELFIKAVTLSCAHSFCEFCINEWKKTKHECPMCRNPIVSVVPSLALDNFISQYMITMPEDLQQRRKESVEERKVAASAASANVPGSSGRSSGGRRTTRSHTIIADPNRNGRVEIRTQIHLRAGTTASTRQHTTRVTVNSRAVAPVVQQHPPAPPTNAAEPSPIDITTDEDELSSDSYHGYHTEEESRTDTSESDGGIPGAYYGGYGHCYNCGRRGHWSNGCPYY